MEENEIREDIKKYSAIEAVALSDGGKLIMTSLKKDIVSSVDKLCSDYKEASHTELIATISQMASKIALLRTFNRSSKNKKIAQEELELLLNE